MGTIILVILAIAFLVFVFTILTKSDNTNTPAPQKRTFLASPNQCQPYEQVYGSNLTEGACAVSIQNAPNLSTLVIIRRDNADGEVAGHVLIPKGGEETICLEPGTYQGFFISGDQWIARKLARRGLVGAFQSVKSSGVVFSPIKIPAGVRLSYIIKETTISGLSPVSPDSIL